MQEQKLKMKPLAPSAWLILNFLAIWHGHNRMKFADRLYLENGARSLDVSVILCAMFLFFWCSNLFLKFMYVRIYSEIC